MVAGNLDLASIAKIPNLRLLEIDDAVTTPLRISSLAPLRASTHLQEFSLLKTVVENADLTPLADLPNLRKLRLGSHIAAEVVDQLRAARPDMEIQYTPPDPKFAALQEVIGAVTILKPGPGQEVWSIFQSFAPALNLKTNYDAERRLKSEIKKSIPEISQRLDWDTEADAVAIYAPSESDIRSVASLINSLLAS
jgi:hypothetical protein